MSNVDLSDPILTGLIVPPQLGPGRHTADVMEPWYELVGQLMSRGCATPYQLKKLLGIHFRTARNMIKIVHDRWAQGLSDELVNIRRESLYHEADEVARAAWKEAMTAETPSEKASLFKVALLANQRKAALTGLDSIEVKINKRITQHTSVELVQRVEQDHGLAPGALAALGRSASKLLSAPQADLSLILDHPEPVAKPVESEDVDATSR